MQSMKVGKMKASELIKRLESLDPNTEVCVFDPLENFCIISDETFIEETFCGADGGEVPGVVIFTVGDE